MIKIRISFKSYCILLCVVGLVALEIILRIYLPSPYVLRIDPSNELTRKLGFYNDKSFNNGFPPKEQQNEIRVLLLGDSYITEGCGLFLDEGETLLKSNDSEQIYTIRELSCPGWGTDQEYLAFMELAREFQPEVVILVFCVWNDVANNLSKSHEATGNTVKPYFVLENNKLVLCYTNGTLQSVKSSFISRWSLRFNYWLYRHVRLYAHFLRTFEFIFRKPLLHDSRDNINGLGDRIYPKFNYQWPTMLTNRITHYLQFIKKPKPVIVRNNVFIDLFEYGHDLTVAIFEKLNSEVTSYGGKFYVMLLPFANPYGWTSDQPERVVVQPDGQEVTLDFVHHINELKSRCEDSGITVFDFQKEMEQRYGAGGDIINNTMHFNSIGDVFIRDSLFSYFIKHIAYDIAEADLQ